MTFKMYANQNKVAKVGTIVGTTLVLEIVVKPLLRGGSTMHVDDRTIAITQEPLALSKPILIPGSGFPLESRKI